MYFIFYSRQTKETGVKNRIINIILLCVFASYDRDTYEQSSTGFTAQLYFRSMYAIRELQLGRSVAPAYESLPRTVLLRTLLHHLVRASFVVRRDTLSLLINIRSANQRTSARTYGNASAPHLRRLRENYHRGDTHKVRRAHARGRLTITYVCTSRIRILVLTISKQRALLFGTFARITNYARCFVTDVANKVKAAIEKVVCFFFTCNKLLL